VDVGCKYIFGVGCQLIVTYAQWCRFIVMKIEPACMTMWVVVKIFLGIKNYWLLREMRS
jgi:hypothetical protein